LEFGKRHALLREILRAFVASWLNFFCFRQADIGEEIGAWAIVPVCLNPDFWVG
jgi:hypothetical protein